MPKICSMCKQNKALELFPKKSMNYDGRDTRCRDCWRVVRGSKPKGLVNGTWFANMFQNVKKRAKIKGLEFTLTNENTKPMIEYFCKHNKYSFAPRNPFMPSIDRIDNNKGYTPDNVQIVWYIENLCKNKFTEEDVIEFCKLKLEKIKGDEKPYED